MNRTARYIFTPALCFILLLTTADCLALRCGDQIVHIGEDMDTVHRKCGRPDLFTVIRAWEEGNPPPMKSTYRGYYANTSGSRSWVERSDEEWLYNCGSGDFAYTLVFEDNVLVRENTQRGYGPNKCISGHEKWQLEMKKKQEEQLKARNKAMMASIKMICTGGTISLMQLRNQHMSKARELFPDENNMTNQFKMYREQYMTDEERILMPLQWRVDENRCVPMNLRNVRTYTEPNSFKDSPKKTIADVKQKPITHENESGSWFQCKDKDGNVTLSNVSCPE
ncbi:MAG TPA: DUF2845 domain-containing protein [Smithellaceae bacterium]|nr:DUF2845 domain-containing protein [Smithellaceae bacterium]